MCREQVLGVFRPTKYQMTLTMLCASKAWQTIIYTLKSLTLFCFLTKVHTPINHKASNFHEQSHMLYVPSKDTRKMCVVHLLELLNFTCGINKRDMFFAKIVPIGHISANVWTYVVLVLQFTATQKHWWHKSLKNIRVKFFPT